ncbi:hypothetical protein [Aliikangiella sp. IMCC44359]|uniref:hypothetical protein n=1 Tax=Aliikangiella sp. IMCC44359 TaxID=3459125 RepID=UPI00403AE8AB
MTVIFRVSVFVCLLNKISYECPVDLRNKSIQVRYARNSQHRVIVFFNEQRMGEANVLNLHDNAFSQRYYREVDV